MALRALPRCWAHLAGFSDGIKWYPAPNIIIIIYPALSAVIGGQDGLDGSRVHWMTCSIIRPRHQSERMVFVVEDVGRFFPQKYLYISVAMRYICIFYPLLCLRRGGNGWMGAGSFG